MIFSFASAVAIAQLVDRQPDVILLDYNLSSEKDKINGLETAEKILESDPNFKIMMLTMHDSADFILPCITAGVHGYMLKSEKNSDIGAAIEQLYPYGQYFSPEVAKDLAISTGEIAEAICISPHGRDTHRKNLIQKYVAKNSVQVIYLALQKGILSVQT